MSLIFNLTKSIMDSRYKSLVQAVDGYNHTGIPLVAQLPDQTLVPAGFSDDIGMYYFIPKIANFFHLSLEWAIYFFFISVLGVSFILGLIGLFFLFKNRIGWMISAVALFLLFLFVYIIWDVYVVSAALPIATIPYILLFAAKKRISFLWLIFVAVVGIIAGTGNIIRGYAGTSIILFLIILISQSKHWYWRQKIAFILISIVGFILPTVFSQMMINKRDIYIREHQPNYMNVAAEHPFWHSVYIGFGFLNNNLGITYNDEVAAAKVKSINPNARYLSKEYEAILRSEVIKLIREKPEFFLQSIFAKLGVILMYFLIFANFGLVAIYFRDGSRQIDLAFGLTLAFAALFGILVIPAPAYLLGFISLAVLYGVINLNLILEKGRTTRKILVED